MKLYYHPISGHAHRARLFLSLIGADVEIVNVDLAKGEHKAADFITLNRFGQVPVLDDDGTIVPDSNAIMVYAAKKFGRKDWLPEDAAGAAKVQRWLSVAAGLIAFGPAAARLVTIFKAPYNPEEVINRAHGVLKVIDAELEGRLWIAATTPTIADVALYSYIARAPEGNVDLAAYRNVDAWLRRIEALPGFVEFGKTAVGLNA
ncbi:MAG: glutathione S-transferase [Hyphomonas sp.]|uniref:glutathione S-transferase family protein n=1 Tax=Hyphomonas sp. TaxID=87 RepID=UPI0018340A84|nr:glutathione S-transferase [Hyphomonas sp.]MBA3067835.1 glutathione S-transferase [Hyphomonas sp.]MBU3919948.1 glutathione S-transferase [Alphaproteobacteria bacterium]MBU4062391.1 glutathione S-transferase [Alphaproteobacteria bacterium]MBU4166001.1 glutathione S-transferase [Alphaproteobacteria bacterium]